MSRFREAIRTSDFAVTAQLNLSETTNPESVLKQTEILKPVVDAIQVTDNPNGIVHISPLVVAHLLLQENVDPVLHMTCRDRNGIALRSDLLGVRALGINNLLIQRGDKLPDGYLPKTEPVFEISSKQLIRAAHKLGAHSGENEFYIGAVATAFNPKSGWQAKSLKAKADAGVRFLQTQICFDADLLGRYMKNLVSLRLTHRVNVIASLAILRSGEQARWARDHLHGAMVPESIIQRLDQAQDPEAEGIRICSELIQQYREIPGIAGINLITPGNIETIPTAIQAAGLRS